MEEFWAKFQRKRERTSPSSKFGMPISTFFSFKIVLTSLRDIRALLRTENYLTLIPFLNMREMQLSLNTACGTDPSSHLLTTGSSPLGTISIGNFQPPHLVWD
jgi:hypothetical protein